MTQHQFDNAAFAKIVPGLMAGLVASEMSAEDACIAITDYRNLLMLTAEGESVTPPRFADLALHEHLEQSGFADDMLLICGRVPTHDADVAADRYETTWAATAQLWSKRYGETLERDGDGRLSRMPCVLEV